MSSQGNQCVSEHLKISYSDSIGKSCPAASNLSGGTMEVLSPFPVRCQLSVLAPPDTVCLKIVLKCLIVYKSTQYM